MKLYVSLISYSTSLLASSLTFSIVIISVSMRTNLGNSNAKYPAGDHVWYIARAANARMIIHHLAFPIPSSLPQRTTYACHVRGNRKSGTRLLHGRLVIPLVAVNPCAIQATYDTFAFDGHCVQWKQSASVRGGRMKCGMYDWSVVMEFGGWRKSAWLCGQVVSRISTVKVHVNPPFMT